jgi:hypothetical protein
MLDLDLKVTYEVFEFSAIQVCLCVNYTKNIALDRGVNEKLVSMYTSIGESLGQFTGLKDKEQRPRYTNKQKKCMFKLIKSLHYQIRDEVLKSRKSDNEELSEIEKYGRIICKQKHVLIAFDNSYFNTLRGC